MITLKITIELIELSNLVSLNKMNDEIIKKKTIKIFRLIIINIFLEFMEEYRLFLIRCLKFND
jgi:hypothetical protein